MTKLPYTTPEKLYEVYLKMKETKRKNPWFERCRAALSDEDLAEFGRLVNTPRKATPVKVAPVDAESIKAFAKSINGLIMALGGIWLEAKAEHQASKLNPS